MLSGGAGLGDSFQLLIGLAEIHSPRLWVETHPQNTSQVPILYFYQRKLDWKTRSFWLFASEVLCNIESGHCTFHSDGSRFVHNNRIGLSKQGRSKRGGRGGSGRPNILLKKKERKGERKRKREKKRKKQKQKGKK